MAARKHFIGASVFLCCAIIFGLVAPVHAKPSVRYCTLTFCSSETGKVLFRKKLTYGKSYTFTSPPREYFDYKHYTFMGWDSVRGKMQNAGCCAGKTISRVKQNMVFYDVAFPRAQEKTPDLPRLSSRYKEVILVGDSRMVGIQRDLAANYPSSDLGTILVNARSGQGLAYFTNSSGAGSQHALEKILNKDNEPGGKPIAIVVAYGVNDLRRVKPNSCELASIVQSYTTTMQQWAAGLKQKYNVTLFYASIAPVNHTLNPIRYVKAVLQFNQQLAANLKDDFCWINTYKQMMNNGFSYSERTDGVHYSEKTNLQVAKYILSAVNKKK